MLVQLVPTPATDVDACSPIGATRSIAPSIVGLFTIGALITVFTGRGVLFSGGRQVVIGGAVGV
jgi:hypothetical protein